MTARLASRLAAGLLALGTAHAAEPDLLVGAVGGTDVVRGDRAAADVRLEYRAALSLAPFTEPLFAVHPWAGIEATTRGSVWGGGGLLLDIPLGPLSLVPQAGVGLYGEGNGKPLGAPVEFRTGIELAYRFGDGSRVGAMFTHTSDAGLTRRNPGTEAVVVSFQVPLGLLLGR